MVSADVEIRPYVAADLPSCEHVIREAFWNVYRPGCHEHWLWHRAMQGHPDLVEELTFVATVDGHVVGCVMSSIARIAGEAGGVTTVVTPGPVAVRPDRQGRGIGALLMQATIETARTSGFPAAFLYGSPDYYPRFGFVDASRFGVSTASGDNFPAFMGCELQPGALDGVRGRLHESSIFEVDEATVEEFDSRFPPRRKERTPTQL